MRAIATVLLLVTVILAGCIGDEETPVTGGPTQESPYENVTIEISHQGELELAIGVCAAGGSGIGTSPCNGGQVTYRENPNGTVLNADLSLSWDAVNPVMEELYLVLAWDCDDQGCNEIESNRGESPVMLTEEDMAEDDRFFILVGHDYTGTSDAFIRHTTPQSFQLEGEFTVRMPTDASSE